MDTSKAELVLLAQCPICQELCQDNRQLAQCRHSFCFECLKSWWIQHQYNFKCPLCKQDAILPEGDINLAAKDFQKNSLVEILSKWNEQPKPLQPPLVSGLQSQEPSKTCDICSNEAKIYCVNCDEQFCVEHSTEIHSKKRKDHQLVDISKKKEVQKEKCAKHPSEFISFFCHSCNLIVCRGKSSNQLTRRLCINRTFITNT